MAERHKFFRAEFLDCGNVALCVKSALHDAPSVIITELVVDGDIVHILILRRKCLGEILNEFGLVRHKDTTKTEISGNGLLELPLSVFHNPVLEIDGASNNVLEGITSPEQIGIRLIANSIPIGLGLAVHFLVDHILVEESLRTLRIGTVHNLH